MASFDINYIIQALKSSYGKDFLDTITMQLHKVVGADYTFIAKLDTQRYVSETLSLVAGDNFGENFEYSLEHTPCADVSEDFTCIYPDRICTLYPQDQLLIDMGIEGYIGSPLHNSEGKVFGLVVALYSKRIESAKNVAALFELFSGRISAELERIEKEAQLKELNETLELKVAKRTSELEKSIEQLKQSQEQLVEQEKLASLGRLVAGVAHEVNTPLGIAVLSNSTIIDNIVKIEQKLSDNKLSKTDLESFISDTKEASEGAQVNLERAAELVSNFKQMATDFHSDKRLKINLNDWLSSLTMSLKPLLKKSGIAMTLVLPEAPLKVTTFPSRLAQVITNIVSNTVSHAFPEDKVWDDKVVLVELNSNASEYTLVFVDNGKGMDEKTKAKILEPFFTTSRSSGGMGLGMSIVHNLVTNGLGGKLHIDSEKGKGTKITLAFELL